MTLGPRFIEALIYAVQLHAGQLRRLRGVPYVAHLLAVASIALDYGSNEDETIAALLHDAIEDQGGPTTGDEIRRRFGPNVAAIVEGCSDSHTTPKAPWHERKDAFLARLPDASSSVRLVVAADTLHNLRSLIRDYRRAGSAIWEHFHGGGTGTLWYYRRVVEALKQTDVSPLIDEVDRTVGELTRLARPS